MKFPPLGLLSKNGTAAMLQPCFAVVAFLQAILWGKTEKRNGRFYGGRIMFGL
jgi:hypothetical protein